MAYNTVANFVAFVGEVEARALAPAVAPATGYDVARIQAALESVSNTADTYFAAQYPTPLNPVPQVVADAVIELAREQLDRQGRDVVTKAADRRRAWLKDVAVGKATLGVTAEEAPATSANLGGVLIDAPDRVFDDDGLAAFLGAG